jgi:hypothetical protein
MTVCLVMVWGCLLTLGGAVNDEQFNLDFVARTFPAAIVHTMELSSGALSMQERWWQVSWENG